MTLVLRPALAVAQDPYPSPANQTGFEPNRDYLSLQPWEAIDTSSGNMIVTFTDLLLPGNAGRNLAFQRGFNAAVNQRWSFGLSDLPLEIGERARFTTQQQITLSDGFGPTLLGLVSGTGIRTVFETTVTPANQRWVTTADFWRYDRDTRRLYTTDGRILAYDYRVPDTPLERWLLTEVRDPFGVTATLSWSAGSVTVVQHLGGNDSRTVNVTFTSDHQPSGLTYADENRTWTYSYQPVDPGFNQLLSVTDPEGRIWAYTYKANPFGGQIASVTTPFGGTVQYEYDTQYYQIGPTSADTTPMTVLSERRVGSDEWLFNYHIGSGTTVTWIEVTTPSGVGVRSQYGAVSSAPEGGWALQDRWVFANGSELEHEHRTYTTRPLRADGYAKALLATRTISRQGNQTTYTTQYDYRTTDFGDYHTPYQVTETGEISRQTTRTFYHFPNGAHRLVALPRKETTTIAGVSTYRERMPNPATGFPMWEEVDGMVTTFDPDPFGNVETVTNDEGESTGYEYRYGQVISTITPEYTVTRTINPDGTVASETRGGRTTSYQYDEVGRVEMVTPPGSSATTTSYGTNTITTERGESTQTVTLDGFGRPVETIDSTGVRTVTTYDAEGRVNFQGLPFSGSGNGPGTAITYDAFGRVKRETHADTTYRERTYSGQMVDSRDEENHHTEYHHQAFGHPDDARLAKVVDATDAEWNYSYTVTGALKQVSGPNGVQRTWTYDANTHLLVSESHPESGTVTYEQYDGARRLTRKRDAKGAIFTYDYDNNGRLISMAAGGRVTTIEYEAGTDNRRLTTVSSPGMADQVTVYDYDSAGRLRERRDTVDSRPFITHYDYDANDNLARIRYPSGRSVLFDFSGAENRLTEVKREALDETTYAHSFLYHPSGAIRQFTAGNNVINTIDFHPTRYWVGRIRATGANLGSPLDLTYQYDDVGNVEHIVDPRSGMTQNFTYDVLDRLASAEAPNGGYGITLFDYDAHGNRLHSNYSYSPTNRFRLMSANGIDYDYDDNGNLTDVGANQVYFYTPNNLLDRTSASGPLTRFAYDADDWRIKKSIDAGLTTYYVRGLNNELLSEWSSDSTVRDYIYAGSRLVAVVEASVALPGSGGGNGSTQHTFALESDSGRFVVAEGGGDDEVNVDRVTVGEWETFTLIDVDGGTLADGDYVYLRTINGRYLTAELGGGSGEVSADRVAANTWETFKLELMEGSGPISAGSKVAFQTSDGAHYLQAETGGGDGKSLITTPNSPGAWESFVLTAP